MDVSSPTLPFKFHAAFLSLVRSLRPQPSDSVLSKRRFLVYVICMFGFFTCWLWSLSLSLASAEVFSYVVEQSNASSDRYSPQTNK